jgi:hypothetical protein
MENHHRHHWYGHKTQINKHLRIITKRERERERERICQTTAGGRGQGGDDPMAEEERAEEECGTNNGSQA